MTSLIAHARYLFAGLPGVRAGDGSDFAGARGGS